MMRCELPVTVRSAPQNRIRITSDKVAQYRKLFSLLLHQQIRTALALRKFFSLFLVTVFFIQTVPDDLLHLLSNHHDTVDHHSEGTAISAKHIHCTALQISLPAFSKAESSQIAAQIAFVQQILFSPKSSIVSFFSLSPSGRAPPILA